MDLRKVLGKAGKTASVIVKESVGVRVPPSRKWDREIAKILISTDTHKKQLHQ